MIVIDWSAKPSLFLNKHVITIARKKEKAPKFSQTLVKMQICSNKKDPVVVKNRRLVPLKRIKI